MAAYKYTKTSKHETTTDGTALFVAKQALTGMLGGNVNKVTLTLESSEIVVERSDLDNNKWLLTISSDIESQMPDFD